MPIYSLTYILPNAERGESARLLCNKCGSQPSWHQGAADRPDLSIQLRCDECLNVCAEFLTEQARDEELAQMHERAVLLNTPIRTDRPRIG
jgi:hypothetical protein